MTNILIHIQINSFNSTYKNKKNGAGPLLVFLSRWHIVYLHNLLVLIKGEFNTNLLLTIGNLINQNIAKKKKIKLL